MNEQNFPALALFEEVLFFNCMRVAEAMSE